MPWRHPVTAYTIHVVQLAPGRSANDSVNNAAPGVCIIIIGILNAPTDYVNSGEKVVRLNKDLMYSCMSVRAFVPRLSDQISDKEMEREKAD